MELQALCHKKGPVTKSKGLRRMIRVIVCVYLVSMVQAQGGNNNIVRTTKGYVQGVSQGQTIRFLGIPYATAQRFQYPNSDIPSWRGAWNSSAVGPMCYQHCDSANPDLYCLSRMSEDCLTLNVYRPNYNPSAGETFPVIVYIHGGDFASGSGGAPVYDGDYFASRGHVIVVTINYRLGAFGFLSIFDKYGDASGNFGFRDQQAAMAWVKANIQAFGGNPEKITLMGDGAGCLSIVSHLTSPTSQPLFTSAILQSCPLKIPFRTRREATLQAERFAKLIGCEVNDVTCYRNRRAYDIVRAQMAVKAEDYSQNMLMEIYTWGPSIDGHVIYYHPLDVFKDVSRFENKPIIMGTVMDEAADFVYKKFPSPLLSDRYNDWVSRLTGQRPSSSSGSTDMRDDLVNDINDYVFSCPIQFAATQIEKKQKLSSSLPGQVWLYEFHTPTSLPLSLSEQQQQLTTALWPSLSSSSGVCDKKSCHGSDVRVMFNSDALPLMERLKGESLSKQMIRYWSNFARVGSVNGAISSRSHLQTLQLHTALLSDSQSFFSRTRPRSQRISLSSMGLGGDHVVTPLQTVIQSALSTFTYWPHYSTEANAPEKHSTMILQTPPLVIRRFYWLQRCQNWSA